MEIGFFQVFLSYIHCFLLSGYWKGWWIHVDRHVSPDLYDTNIFDDKQNILLNVNANPINNELSTTPMFSCPDQF